MVVWSEPVPFSTSRTGAMPCPSAPARSSFAEKAPRAKRATGASIRIVRRAAAALGMSRLSSATPTRNVGLAGSIVS